MRRLLLPILTILLVVLVFGCSNGSGVSNPAMPDLTSGTQSETTARSVQAQKDLWGWWAVTIDPVAGTVDVVPVREAMFRANVTQWMQPPAGRITNLKINIVDLSTYMTDGRIVVDVSLTHPFPGLVDYTGFDVHGIFMHNGPSVDGLDPTATYAWDASDAAILENPDGYTRWWNYSEFQGPMPVLSYTPGALGDLQAPTATLNPYKYFANGLDAEDDVYLYLSDPDASQHRAHFLHGFTNTRRYNLRFPMVGGSPMLRFQYAVAASWEPGDEMLDGSPGWKVPDDFPLSANQGEPCLINIDSSESSLYFVEPGNAGGNLRLNLEIFKWSALDPVSPMVDISKIGIASCTSCTKLPVTMSYEGTELDALRIPDSGTAISSVWSIDIAGIEPTATGPAPFMVTVEPTSPTDYDQGFGLPSSDAHLAAYQLGWVEIGVTPDCIPPTAYAEATTETEINIGDTVEFDASETTGTPPFTWSWDWDGDGTYDEDTDEPIITHMFMEEGTFYVMCRATNACGEDEIDEPIEIVVGGCGTGLPTWGQYWQGTDGHTCPYFFGDLNATVNDSEPKLVAQGSWVYTDTEKKIFLTLPSAPTTIVATYTWTGSGDIYGKPNRMAVDGSTEGIDRIVFCPNESPPGPRLVDWDGSTFTPGPAIPPMPYGSVWSLCVTDEGDIIAHNNIGPQTRVYMWDKQNNYAVSQIFYFTNSYDSVPYGSSLGNIGQLGWDPSTQAILFPVGNSAISMGGQLYGFSVTGTRIFDDTNVYGTNLSEAGDLFGVTVDFSAPTCRILFHGAPNGSAMWVARFINDMEDKIVGSITNSLDNAGGPNGCLIGTDFWTNSNNWNYRVIKRSLPSDW